ncbi:MAG: energy-coupling factor transporter transmembrane protein EcfT [Anaeroplasmataceae bacterium]|jgi:ABC-type cobalt transport system, permease component CbiQ and related transporters|nr:energy-coupling factor transporter transmembrane protein EcfT [Anaeroplasmataceae bacterium]HRF70509.1 energy-coupling factor transporter transmembrane component T [Candidatus Pelethenecus sp.]
MNNITIGQYVPGNSWIYKLDPRTKVILTILSIVVIFLIPSFYGILIALGIFILIFLSTRVSILRVIRGLKPLIFLLGFTFLLQLIYNRDGTLLYTFDMQIGLFQTLIMLGIVIVYFLTKKYIKLKFLWTLLMLASIFFVLWFSRFDLLIWSDFKFEIYDSGLKNATFVFVRIFIMIGITSLLTLSTMSMDINNGLEWLLAPLKLIRIPVSVFSMTIALTLRFIPTLYEESRKIMNAQASRGVDFQEGRLKDKVSQIISLLIPMFVISFRRAEDLSNAMEARGYVIGAKRTKLDELKFRLLDYFCFGIVLVFLGLAIWSNFLG